MTSVRMYNELINEYANFKKELPEDIVSRLYQELVMVRNIMQSVKLQKLDVDVFEYEQIAQNNLQELHKLGYKRIV